MRIPSCGGIFPPALLQPGNLLGFGVLRKHLSKKFPEKASHLLRQLECRSHPQNVTSEELRVALEASPKRRGFVWLVAIRSLLLGVERTLVCIPFCRSDRIVRVWIAFYNALCNQRGRAALASKPHSGRPRQVRRQRARDLLEPVRENPQKPLANSIGRRSSCTGG